MDGPHDLGGKQGFGPIDVTHSDPAFHHDWEGRMWAMAKSTGAPDWTIDWWRHIRELIMPEDYLDRNYFDSWAQTQLAGFINSGIFSLEEAVSGEVTPGNYDKPAPRNLNYVLHEEKKQAARFDGPAESDPGFKTGDRVKTAASGHTHHTRLPQYARGKSGRIADYRGAHVFPDLSAQGIEEFHHLYSVEFDAGELWPEAKGRNDRVYLDLWEDYFVTE